LKARTRWIAGLLAGVAILWLAEGLRAESRRTAADQAKVMESLDLFTRVFEKITTYYVEEDVDPNDLVHKAIEGMLQGLDPHSQFLDTSMYDDLMTSTQGSFGGLGIEISVRDKYPTDLEAARPKGHGGPFQGASRGRREGHRFLRRA
jgi:carboxyl-terminal processing protease